MYITFSTRQFKQVWCLDVDQTLYLPSRNIKSLEASGAPPRTQLGELKASPQTP